MRIYELEIGWVETAVEARHLRWELTACDEVRGVFASAREDTVLVLFDDEWTDFDAWAALSFASRAAQ